MGFRDCKGVRLTSCEAERFSGCETMIIIVRW